LVAGITLFLLYKKIAIKYELGLLADDKGIPFAGYEIEVINDELYIDKNREFFKYEMVNGQPQSSEAQRLQKTLFHEKEIIIENCLFGVE
jgi:adenine-specific DNA-methyltransferase